MPAREYELATGNLVMGRFLWLVVRVPEGWAVKIGDSPSDVNYTAVFGNTAWVVDGSTSYFIVNLVTGQVYDLELKVRKGIKNLESKETSPQMVLFNGHNGIVRKKDVRRGLRRDVMKQIIFTIPCVNTSRTIELSLTGKTVEELEDLTEHLKQSKCH